MNSEKWNKIKEVFTLVADLPTGERELALRKSANGDDEILRAVEKLLASEENSKNDSFDDLSLVSRGDEKEAVERKEKIGNYKILRKIGTGGMGEVYLAERVDISQKVALKIIRRGADSDVILRRFRREQEILAALEHPFIARLIDVGITPDGVPFLAMEYVEGADLTAYAQGENLSTNERLILFRKICAAVSYAHSRLVVHRDLKPSNILITKDGEPKLLDFGISKLISETDSAEEIGTVTSLGMLTPNYASPEQFRGETVSTSTDVYSLGVILYELLTGALPYDVTNRRIDEVARIVCETAPRRPSDSFTHSRLVESTKPRPKNQTSKFLRGDLDNILLKSLRKEPARRYSSVEQFSEDLRRHVEGLPVTARPDTFSYRAEKFVRRNAVSVGAGALVFLILIGALLGIYSQYARAERQRVLAESRFNDVRRLANNVVFKYHDAIKDLPGATGARAMLVKDAVEYLDRLANDTSNDAALEHELALAFFKIGNVQGEAFESNLGDSPGAVASYRKSGVLLENLIKRDPNNAVYYTDLQKSNFKLVALQSRRQEWNEAYALSERNLELGRFLLARDSSNAEYRFGLAVNYFNHGDAVSFAEGFEGSVKWFKQALPIIEDLRRADPSNESYRRRQVAAFQRIGTQTEYWCDALREQNAPEADIRAKLEEAVAAHSRSVALSEELMGDFPNNEIYRRYVAATTNNLCSAYARLGDGRASLENGRRALALFQEIADADSKNNEARHDLGEARWYLGMGFEAANNFGKALENFKQSAEIFESLTAHDPTNSQFPSQANALHNRIGDLLLKTNRAADARDEYARGLDFVERFTAANGNESVGAVLRCDSNYRLGRAFERLSSNRAAANDERAANLDRALAHYEKAQSDLSVLEKKGALGFNDRYKLELIAADLRRCAQEKTDSGA